MYPSQYSVPTDSAGLGVAKILVTRLLLSSLNSFFYHPEHFKFLSFPLRSDLACMSAPSKQKPAAPPTCLFANMSTNHSSADPAGWSGGGAKLITARRGLVHVFAFDLDMSTIEKTRKKRRKYSKKSKKNLRKYTDIRDVEEFLEEQRFQERTG